MSFMRGRIIKIAGILLTIFFIVGSIEVISFFTYKLLPDTYTGLRDWKKYFSNSGLFRDIDVETYYNDQASAGKNVIYDPYIGYRFPPNFRSKYINTNSEGFRVVPPINKERNASPRVRVAFFGDSTMFGIGADDTATIPALFSSMLNERNKEIFVDAFNYGVPGFTSSPLTILLLEKLANNKFDYVIFYGLANEAMRGFEEYLGGALPTGLHLTGFINPPNDTIQPALYNYIENAPGLFTYLFTLRRWLSFTYTKKIYSVIIRRMLISSSYRTNLFSEGANKRKLGKKEKDIVKRIINIYARNKAAVEALGQKFDFIPLFFIPPYLLAKKVKSDYENHTASMWEKGINGVEMAVLEEVYGVVKERFCRDQNFLDISGSIDTPDTVFVDELHMSGGGNRLVVKAMLNNIEELVVGNGNRPAAWPSMEKRCPVTTIQ